MVTAKRPAERHGGHPQDHRGHRPLRRSKGFRLLLRELVIDPGSNGADVRFDGRIQRGTIDARVMQDRDEREAEARERIGHRRVAALRVPPQSALGRELQAPHVLEAFDDQYLPRRDLEDVRPPVIVEQMLRLPQVFEVLLTEPTVANHSIHHGWRNIAHHPRDSTARASKGQVGFPSHASKFCFPEANEQQARSRRCVSTVTPGFSALFRQA